MPTLFILILFCLSIGMIIGLVYGLIEGKYKLDLYHSRDTSKLRSLGIEKLELKRYLHTFYAGKINSASKRNLKEIRMDLPDQSNTKFFTSQEDELYVIGLKKGSWHKIYVCPFSPDNRQRFENIINDYNAIPGVKQNGTPD